MGQVVAFVGALFILLAAVGVVRLDDTLSRMHALTKASTLGVLLVLGGAALVMPKANDWTSLVLAMVLQVLTSPISANVISRSVHLEALAAHEQTPNPAGDQTRD